MMIKTFSLLVALSALLLVAQATPSASETNELPDIIFIGNVDTNPTILSPQEALLGGAQRNLICTPVLCARVCAALGFWWSGCNANRVCVCRR
ncbi:unnamed protein product, partial [Brenthis ino]